MSVDHVYDLMARAGELPYGEAKTVLVEDALRQAEAAGEPELAFRVRMELTTAYQYGGEPAKAFTTFSRCLADHDRDPGRFDEGARLLWQIKWMVNSLTLFPEIPLDRTYAILDEMERRYLLGGHSLQAVYHYRHAVARHVGDAGAADEWYARWRAAPRDELSDCAGCDPTGMVYHLASRERDEEALAIAAPVLSAELNCTEQPQGILTALLPVYLRTGRVEDARDAHRRGYRIMRSNIADFADIAEHIEFCAQTGNEPRGLEILQRHLGWLDRAPSPHSAMRFAAASALLLRRLDETGHGGEVSLRRPAHGDRKAADVSAAELRAELTEQATQLAARFDARNGTTYQGDLVREILAAGPIVDHLPLTAHDRRPTTATPPQVMTSTEAVAPDRRPAADYSDVDDLDALLAAADERWQARDLDSARAAWHRFDEVLAATDAVLTTGQSAQRADGRGLELLMSGEAEAGLAEWWRAAELYAEAGDPVLQHSVLSRIGGALMGLGQPDEGVPLLTTAVAYLDEHAPGTRRALTARLRLSGHHLESGSPEETIAVLADLTPDEPHDIGNVELNRARALAHLGRHEEAVAALRRACDALRTVADRDPLAEAAFMLGQLLSHDPAGLDEALAAFDETLANAVLPMLRLAAHAERGRLLLSHERAADAVADLVEAVAGFTAEGAHAQAAHARVELAAAYYTTGRHFEAAEVAEEAAPMLAQLDDSAAERRLRFILAHSQRELGEPQAAELFTELAREDDEPGAAAQLLETAAEVLTGLDKDALAAERFAESADAFAKAGNPYGVVRTRRRGALCHLWSGREDEALAEMERARAGLKELPPDNPAALTWETSMVAYDEARLLANVSRYDEALRSVGEAIEGYTSLNETDAAEAALRLRSSIQDELS
ncbi:hypothetical protein [Actinomadura rudentiformis]|uniref:Tetratricopeptide repeat protein n=1 Tax=Actinomadura rudentiformis TaxID=359158 RepID=A0A6H9YTJ6_9ACTN|nr:hypothetical protein [Actinomadura rudentiformis]KAB2351690.1 hypothetical protein F8566_05595 [Actinomadura rudentiformis]